MQDLPLFHSVGQLASVSGFTTLVDSHRKSGRIVSAEIQNSVYGYLWVSWVSMGVYEFLGVYGYLWVSVGALWMFVGIYECQWVSMGVYGFLGVYGYLWVFMALYRC